MRGNVPAVESTDILMSDAVTHDSVIVFSTALGWMAIVGGDNSVKQLVFGYPTSEAAARALQRRLVPCQHASVWLGRLAGRLRAYAEGNPDDFLDVPLDPGEQTKFRHRVLLQCRKIPYGGMVTYGQLAERAGVPGAARAVGNCMAANRLPLLIPCHRVVPASGYPGPFSAPGGSRMKQRLLSLEANPRGAGRRDLG
jgi:methylated-DNA-[protein]-cysteine S-methyltransferase